MGHIFDKETREKLDGLLPFSQDAIDKYTPALFEDVDEKFRPVFHVRTFNRSEAEKVKRAFKNIKATREEELIEFARRVTVNWENLIDMGTEEEIEYLASEDGTGADKDTFKRLPTTTITQILKHASIISGLLDVEKLGLK